jgi:phosphorylated adapter RNA export protein
LQKYFTYTKRPQISRNEDASSQGSALIDDEIESQVQKEMLDDPEQLKDVDTPASDNKAQRKPLADRIHIPVAYEDLFEEGEIHKGEPLEAFRRLCLVKSCEAQRNDT